MDYEALAQALQRVGPASAARAAPLGHDAASDRRGGGSDDDSGRRAPLSRWPGAQLLQPACISRRTFAADDIRHCTSTACRRRSRRSPPVTKWTRRRPCCSVPCTVIPREYPRRLVHQHRHRLAGDASARNRLLDQPGARASARRDDGEIALRGRVPLDSPVRPRAAAASHAAGVGAGRWYLRHHR